MKDFFSQFRDNLSSRPEPIYNEQDWQRLSSRLEGTPKKPFLSYLAWLGFLLGSLFMFLNISLWFQIKDIRNTIHNTSKNLDTLYICQTLQNTDTIYIIEKLRPQKSSESLITSNRINKLLEENNELKDKLARLTKNWKTNSTYEKNQIESKANIEIEEQKEYFNTNSALTESQNPKDLIDKLKENNSLHSEKETQNTKKPEIQIPAQNKNDENNFKNSLIKYSRSLQPKNYLFMASGGFAKSPMDGKHIKLGWTSGLGFGIEFFKNTQLWVEGNFSKNKLESTRMDDAIGIPTVIPKDTNLTFVNVTAQQKYLLFSTGVSKIFLENNSWRPFLGAGWGLRYAFDYDLIYDFENEAAGISVKYENETPGSVHSKKYSQYIFLRCGVERDFYNDWRMLIDFNFQSNILNEAIHTPKLSSMRLVLMRKF